MKSSKSILLEKEKFKGLHGLKKIQYIWDYYKLPLIVSCIALYIIGYFLYGHFTHKEAILYTALVNISASETLTAQLSTDFLDYLDEDTSKKTVQLYQGLYLTDDEKNPYHEYAYASRMKILASIDNEQLDIVLMNKEAFDAFSQSGYLCNLEELLRSSDSDLYTAIKPYLVTNIAILEDNSMDMQFDSSISYQAMTEEYAMGLDLSQTFFIRQAGFEDTLYLGIIENSTRKDSSVSYIRYLFSENFQ